MGDPAKRPATYQDVLDAPPNVVAEVLSASCTRSGGRVFATR